MINKLNDDYNWDVEYPSYHLWQTKDILSRGEQFFLKRFEIVNDEIIANIHINQKFIYEFCLKNNPSSIYEVGFGYGNHLVNIYKVMKDKPRMAGCDRCRDQYINARKFHNINQYGIEFTIGDFTEIDVHEKYEFVYSNAVLMHMSTEKAKQCIEKMCNISTKWVMVLDGKLPISNAEEFCSKFGRVTMFNEFWSIWTENNTVPILIEVNNV